jgi:hypothetical protein
MARVRERRRGAVNRDELRESTPRWLMLMPSLPGKATTERVRIWRRLQAVGAIAVRPSVYVLPAREDCVETFQWVAKEIGELGGQASLCEGSFLDGVTADEIERRSIEARSADYALVSSDAQKLAASLKGKRLRAEQLSICEASLAKLKRRFDEIVAIDFCDAPAREAADGLLRGVERLLLAHGGPRVRPVPLQPVVRPRGATWVTRVGVHVDRIACAWLIRRFIDHDAKLKFVAPKGYQPAPGELRFDMYEAEFTHVGDRCSFEVLLERMQIDDRGLRAIAEIVHDLDVRDAKYGRLETAGISAQITGICLAHRDDMARVESATPLFESLYAFFVHQRTKGTA